MKLNEIVIGSDLRAFLYAYNNGVSLIYSKLRSPLSFDLFQTNINLEKYYIDYEQHHFVNHKGEQRIYGNTKVDLYDRLGFLLSMSGLLPFGDKVTSIRIDGNILYVYIGLSKMFEVEFDKLIVINPEDIENLNFEIKEENENYIVVDWVDVKSGAEHEYELYESQDSFINTIYFFPSIRTDGNLSREKLRKDLVAISYLKKEETYDEGFSELYARMKIEDVFKELNIKGRKKTLATDGKTQLYRKPRVQIRERDIRLLGFNIYKDYSNVKFLNKSELELIESFNGEEINYVHKLNRMLYGKRKWFKEKTELGKSIGLL